MPERINLTDRKLKSLKAAPAGKRLEYGDRDSRGLIIRVTDTGHKSFAFLARFPGSDNPTRRAIGDYPETTLQDARARAKKWREWIEKGTDPKIAEERERQEELRKQATTFAAVAEDFIREKLPGERRGFEVERNMRRSLLPILGERPITDITDLDVINITDKVK